LQPDFAQSAVSSRYRRQRGLTLLEILITLATVSVGLLGVAALQINGVKSSKEAFMRSQAVYLAYDIAERMRANVATADNYELPRDGSPEAQECHSESCNGDEMAQADLYEWRNMTHTLLGSDATTSIDVVDSTATIVMYWTYYENEKQFTLVADL
jgi:type IV pilus assembly protein PilV